MLICVDLTENTVKSQLNLARRVRALDWLDGAASELRHYDVPWCPKPRPFFKFLRNILPCPLTVSKLSVYGFLWFEF